ncbi:AraC family transcriptional regulator, partial [Variovorax sp. CT11-76]
MSILPVWFVVFERFQLLDVSGPLQVFATANDELRLADRAPVYRTRVLAAQAGPVASSSGLAVQAEAWP